MNEEKKSLIMDKAGNKESLPEVSGVKVSETNRETVVISSKDGEDMSFNPCSDSLLKQESGYIEITRRLEDTKVKPGLTLIIQEVYR